MFYGTIRDKAGRVLDKKLAHTREEAAIALFRRNPKAKTVSTSRAFKDAWSHTWRDAHADIRWIERHTVATLVDDPRFQIRAA